MSMFKYSGTPFRKEFLEYELLYNGWACIVKKDDSYYAGRAVVYEWDTEHLPKDGSNIEFFTRDGSQGQFTLGKDAVIGYNNCIRTPEIGIDWLALEFTNIDVSVDANVKHSIVSGIPVARDAKVSKALSNILDDIRAGVTKIVAGESILGQIQNADGTAKQLEVLHLTQPEQIERVQYLSKLYDDLLRRFWVKYGHSMNSTGKMAQVNEKELEGYETYSMITPEDMLESRKDFIAECNRVFGTSWSVEYSRPWKHLEQQAQEAETPVEDRGGRTRWK